MRVTVIGGTGFIGARVVGHLAEHGHAIMTVQRHRSPLLPSSIRQLSCDQEHLVEAAVEVRRFRPDVVVDMVSSSGRQARATVAAFAGHAGALVAVSSQDVYRAFGVFHGTEPGPPQPVPLSEDSPRRTRRETYPPELLARMREMLGWVNEEYNNAEMEDVVRSVERLPCTVLRLPMVYGPGDYLHRLYPILKRIDDGREIIPIADTVAAWRGPRGYAEDVATAIALAAEAPVSGQIYNVAEEESFSELEWTRLVADAAGWTGRIVVVPFDRAPQHLRLPGNFAQHGTSTSRRIREQLGYREDSSRPEALRQTIVWEREHPPQPMPAFDYAAEDACLAAP